MLARGPETFAQLVPGGATSRFSLSYGRPTSLADGPDGALWMTVDGGNGSPDAILRRDPVESFFMLGADVDPRAIVAGRDGALWFLENGPDRSGHDRRQSSPTSRSAPRRQRWPSARTGRCGTRRARPCAGSAIPPCTRIGSPVTALTAGADGALWAAVRGGLARIVPGEAPTFVRAGSIRPRRAARSPRRRTGACG